MLGKNVTFILVQDCKLLTRLSDTLPVLDVIFDVVEAERAEILSEPI